MEVFKEYTEEYIIKLNSREEAKLLHGILEFFSRDATQKELGDRVTDEEYQLAGEIAEELESYLNFGCQYE